MPTMESRWQDFENYDCISINCDARQHIVYFRSEPAKRNKYARLYGNGVIFFRTLLARVINLSEIHHRPQVFGTVRLEG